MARSRGESTGAGAGGESKRALVEERPVGVEALPDEDVSAEAHPGTDGPSLTELLEMALSEEAWEAFSY